MCKAMERIAERNRAEGEARGERKNMFATAKRMLKSGMLGGYRVLIATVDCHSRGSL